MKYLGFVLLFSSIFHPGLCQHLSLTDTAEIKANTLLIGRYPQYDKSKTYKQYNFLLSDLKEIKDFLSGFKYGEEVDNVLEEPGFDIELVQNNERTAVWSVNFAMGSVRKDGKSYRADLNQISSLSKSHPFDYRVDKKSFESTTEYQNYLAKVKRDESFLFAFEPSFAYEGSFEIEFTRSAKFDSPATISDYLDKHILKIAREEEYAVSYKLDKHNLADMTQYTMTISGSRKLFNQLKVDNLVSKNWRSESPEGWFFFRVK